MGETVVGSTSSASNVHEAANDNTNPYRNMVMDAMRMKQGNVSQYPIVEEELNVSQCPIFNMVMISIMKIVMKVMTIQLMTKKKKILTNNKNEALCKTLFSCNLDYG
jgi:hypothetical protein